MILLHGKFLIQEIVYSDLWIRREEEQREGNYWLTVIIAFSVNAQALVLKALPIRSIH